MIAALINRSYEVENSFIYAPPETEGSISSAMATGTYFVCVDSQGALIGCIYVSRRLQCIFQLTVDAGKRREGYGRRLMEAAERDCKAAGWQEILVSILNFRREELLPIYRRLGYVETGETRIPSLVAPARMIRLCHLILMSKQLI